MIEELDEIDILLVERDDDDEQLANMELDESELMHNQVHEGREEYEMLDIEAFDEVKIIIE